MLACNYMHWMHGQAGAIEGALAAKEARGC